MLLSEIRSEIYKGKRMQFLSWVPNTNRRERQLIRGRQLPGDFEFSLFLHRLKMSEHAKNLAAAQLVAADSVCASTQRLVSSWMVYLPYKMVICDINFPVHWIVA